MIWIVRRLWNMVMPAVPWKTRCWGGLELGCFFICSEGPTEHLLAHEAGHGLQNCLWGPLFPFVIMIPSAIRYWIFQQRTHYDKQNFARGVVTAILSLAAISVIIPVLTQDWSWLILSFGMAFYGCFILCWLFFHELPLHEHLAPDYDDAWFEGQATSWGLEYIATDKI